MKKWSELTQDEKLEWQQPAREIIYPDLRMGYVNHEKMLNEMARAIYNCHCMAAAGGGGHNEGTDRRVSILEA